MSMFCHAAILQKCQKRCVEYHSYFMIQLKLFDQDLIVNSVKQQNVWEYMGWSSEMNIFIYNP